MAKLSARGRKELAQCSLEQDIPAEVPCIHCEGLVTSTDPCAHCNGTGKQASLTSWSRISVALMSDGSILRKYDVRWRSDSKRHSYGWKVLGKKPLLTVEAFRSHYSKLGYV